ncbi:gag-polypeptide of LTR copia-type [Carex littledalei]|uniref:Gag-polypeptide of LTR copia-type n=1 Tax=Carex littledalei TaxID=544730 RepID=A0A833V1Y2_9POAL|nr:gag-polypeptide of LTR copia-type [Carex littledalei]
MINYLNILDLWSVIEKAYEPEYANSVGNEAKVEVHASTERKKLNNLAINAIYNAVSESVALLFGNTTNAKEMWDTLIDRYEGNTQIKRTKIAGLDTKFETFKIENGENVEDMYNRLMHIQNEFIELGEPLSNDKIVGKLLRVMLGA